MTDPVETIRAYEQRVQDIAARAGSARARMAAVRSSATSPDGAVTATVTAVGALSDLAFGPAAERLPLPELARLVVSTAQTARLEAARQTEAAVAELVGAETAHSVMQQQGLDAAGGRDDAPDGAVESDGGPTWERAAR